VDQGKSGLRIRCVERKRESLQVMDYKARREDQGVVNCASIKHDKAERGRTGSTPAATTCPLLNKKYKKGRKI